VELFLASSVQVPASTDLPYDLVLLHSARVLQTELQGKWQNSKGVNEKTSEAEENGDD
jgi:hypothetical protein